MVGFGGGSWANEYVIPLESRVSKSSGGCSDLSEKKVTRSMESVVRGDSSVPDGVEATR